MPPDERRDSLIAAARPLVLEQGANFTTRQVAEAAGVAEGTIFRVFCTKAELVRAVVADALDPTPLTARILAIGEQDADLPTLVADLVDAVATSIRTTGALLYALHTMPDANPGDPTATPTPTHEPADHAHHSDHQDHKTFRSQAVLAAIETTLNPHADELSVPVPLAAAWIRSTALSRAHPLADSTPIADPQLSQLVLTGIQRKH